MKVSDVNETFRERMPEGPLPETYELKPDHRYILLAPSVHFDQATMATLIETLQERGFPPVVIISGEGVQVFALEPEAEVPYGGTD